MHKKSIIRITAALTGCILIASGCIRPEALDPDGEAICFDAGSTLLRNDAINTKATPLPNNTHFGVFAYRWGWSDQRKPDYMFNVDVCYDGSTYSYSPTRFWPPTSTKLSFWAYSPYDDSADLLARGSTVTAYTKSTKNLPDIRFTVDGNTDVMYSNLVTNQTYASNGGVVPLTFTHALSLVDVYAQKDDAGNNYTVQLNTVRFDGLYATAILQSSADWSDWSWYTWSGDRRNYTVWADDPNNNSDDIVLAHNSPTLLTSTPQTKLMLLPQSLSNDACRLHVEFTLTYTTHDDELDENVEHVVPTSRDVYLRNVFSGLANVTWAKNAHYTLTIEISPNKPILFTVTWSDWGDAHNYFLSN